ncbi:MAG: hypothetical protein CVT90_03110 [Candidatus Altiarchaeales archaeon HGW-Altiarchaeales-3]|nr:MAG: hypothetical protein CVT90_03110 [Candidatus Altiarchaeales archaeon HGW-Altiarchaeales-3]
MQDTISTNPERKKNEQNESEKSEKILTDNEHEREESEGIKNKELILLFLYFIAMGAAEIILVYYSLGIGLFIHALIMVFLIILSSNIKEKNSSLFFQTLALLPLLRILSVSIPLIVFLNPIYRFLLIYSPLLLAAFIFIRNNKLRAEDVGISFKDIKLHMIIALSGIIFGIIEYSILKEQITPFGALDPSFSGILTYALILLFFTGFTEELIFRGMLLTNTAKIFSANKSIIFVSILFMFMHIGWNSLTDLLFVFLVSLFYCYVFLKTRSILGITISHGVTNIVEFVILPLML